MSHPSHNSLPEMFRPLLWSRDFDRFDPDRDRHTLIVNTLNYGTLAHWRWLRNYVGREPFRRYVATLPASEFRPPAQRLLYLLCGVPYFQFALRGNH